MGIITWAEALGGKIRTWRLYDVLWDGFYKKEWLVGSHLSVGLPEAKLQICYLRFKIHCCIWRHKGTFINYIYHLNLEKQEQRTEPGYIKIPTIGRIKASLLNLIGNNCPTQTIWGKSGLRRKFHLKQSQKQTTWHIFFFNFNIEPWYNLLLKSSMVI